jgi:hypothetical protein
MIPFGNSKQIMLKNVKCDISSLYLAYSTLTRQDNITGTFLFLMRFPCFFLQKT